MHGISNDIKISVCSELNVDNSKPANGIYFFEYTIYIENKRDHAVQLMSRKWHIRQQYGVETCVEGNGVLGSQPVLQAKDSFCYSSFTYLHCAFGRMHGHYVFKNLETQEMFKVQIPTFDLVLPWSLN